jgi:hypothetical protein
MVPDLDKMFIVFGLISAVVGWALIQSLIWLFSHLHFY